MFKFDSKLVDDNKTTDELLENIEITHTTFKDALFIINTMRDCFDIESDYQSLMQLLLTNAKLNDSVKLIDKRDNKIYGFLIFSENRIDNGSPIRFINLPLTEFLMKYKQINGYSMIIDKRLRGYGLDRKMIEYSISFISNYDFVWCGVDKELSSHNYWKRNGFKELLSIHDAAFYINSLDKKVMRDIFIAKAITSTNNENHIKRTW